MHIPSDLLSTSEYGKETKKRKGHDLISHERHTPLRAPLQMYNYPTTNASPSLLLRERPSLGPQQSQLVGLMNKVLRIGLGHERLHVRLGHLVVPALASTKVDCALLGAEFEGEGLLVVGSIGGQIESREVEGGGGGGAQSDQNPNIS